MNSFHEKPDGVLPDDFGYALNLVNVDAVVRIIQTGTYGTPSLMLTCEWDDDKGAFPTTDEMKAAIVKGDWDRVRKERNELLTATDFYALSDVYMSDDMAAYREALRDLPASVEDSKDVVWPEKP
jgi:hypothetical protein|tara:strand:+ start:134 stop:508 length:375 start_codon:yes stop_codon:yes gene_type:complete